MTHFDYNYNIRVRVKTKIYSRPLRYRSNLVDSLLHSDPTALIFVSLFFSRAWTAWSSRPCPRQEQPGPDISEMSRPAAGEETAPAGPADTAGEVSQEGCNTEQPPEPRSPRKDASTDPYEQSGESGGHT